MPKFPPAETFRNLLFQNRNSSILNIDALIRNCRIIWGVIAAMAVAAVACFRATNLSVAWSSVDIASNGVALLMAVSWLCGQFRPASSIRFSTESCAQLVLVLLIGCALSYPLATVGFPYRDAALNAADLWMGLDWRAYLHFFNDRPVLGILAQLAYTSIFLQLLVLVVCLSASSRLLRLQQYVMATALALVITVFVFVFVPASGIYTFLKIQPVEFANLSPIMSTDQILRLDALRNGQHTLINGMEGLITFPSFHTIWALLFMWAFYPIRQLRYGAILLNMFVIASTPIVGAHYFIDLIGGAAVAAIAIFGTARFSRGSLTSPATQASPAVALEVTGGPQHQRTRPPPDVWAKPACNLFAPVIVKSPMLTPGGGTDGALNEDIHSCS